MRPPIKACTAVLAALISVGPASAYTNVHIDLFTQTMYVTSSRGNFSWPVSTARAGYVTPGGMKAQEPATHALFAKISSMSPMPHSIFFAGGYAIHGTYKTGSLGSPASHGCVRLSPNHAAQLYDMVRSEGGRIAITGSRPRGYAINGSGAQSRDALNYRFSRRRSGAAARHGCLSLQNFSAACFPGEAPREWAVYRKGAACEQCREVLAELRAKRELAAGNRNQRNQSDDYDAEQEPPSHRLDIAGVRIMRHRAPAMVACFDIDHFASAQGHHALMRMRMGIQIEIAAQHRLERESRRGRSDESATGHEATEKLTHMSFPRSRALKAARLLSARATHACFGRYLLNFRLPAKGNFSFFVAPLGSLSLRSSHGSARKIF